MPHFPYRAGNYVLFAELGAGTLGTTYIGREAAQARGGFKPLAIRVLDPLLCQRAEVVRMFLDEQRAAALLQHPRVAPVHEVGALPDGSYFVASEYVHGVPLREVMTNPQAQLQVSQAVHIAMQLCDALHYAHERMDLTGKPLEIIHGQISPETVLVGFDGNIKIIEFGCLRTRNATVASVSLPQKLQKRTAFMAPELRAQLQQPDISGLDRRADVYSVGAMLYELLTGSPPPVDDHEDTGPTPQREIPKELAPVLKKAMAKKRDDRYATALAMRLALSTAASSLMGETSVATILARNMTIAFRPRLTAFQEQIDVWKKFEPDMLPVSNEPPPSSAGQGIRPTTGGVSAFQSQRLATNQSRLGTGSANLQSTGTSGNTGRRLTTSAGQRAGGSTSRPDEQPIFKKPLFLALLGLGVAAILVALVVTISRGDTQPWALYIDSQPRGAEIRIDGKVVGNTPQRISSSTPPTPQRVEILKPGFQPFAKTVTPQPGNTEAIDVQLQPAPGQ